MLDFREWSLWRKLVALLVLVAVAAALAVGACSRIGSNTPPASDQQQPADSSQQQAKSTQQQAKQQEKPDSNDASSKSDGWLVEKKAMTYRHSNGKKATGFVDIGKKTYLFDDKGRQLTGWRVINGDYRYFSIKHGAKGSMVKGKTVNGIVLTDDGVAVPTEEALDELAVLHRAQKCLDELTSPLDSPIEKLGKVYDWMLRECQERGSHPFVDEEGWQRAYALDIFDTKSGSCESFGAAFAYLANAAGFKDCSAVCSDGHAWAEVNGGIYDPEQGKQFEDGWTYFDLAPEDCGKGEIPLYTQSREHVALIAPRTEPWGTVTEEDIAMAEETGGETGWVKEDGTKRYLRNGRQLTQQWVEDGKKKYYLLETGEPATGSTKVDGTWYVFGKSGKLLTGSKTRVKKVDGKRYQVDAEGKAQGGWVEKEVKEKDPGLFEAICQMIFGPRMQKRYYLENGLEAHGDCFAEGKIMAFTEEGDYDEGRSNELQRLCESPDKAKELLERLGEPLDVQHAESCRPGYEDGSENTYRYENLVVRTFSTPDGTETLNYVEANDGSGAVQGNADDSTGKGAAASDISQDVAVDEKVTAFAHEHGDDLESCFKALSYVEDGDNFIRYGSTGRPELEKEFDQARIVQEAHAAFIDRSEGDCYTYTVAFWLVAEKLGYEARPVVGTMVYSSNDKVHNTCWVEVKKGDSWNIYDPLHADKLHDVPYGTYETVKRAE